MTTDNVVVTLEKYVKRVRFMDKFQLNIFCVRTTLFEVAIYCVERERERERERETYLENGVGFGGESHYFQNFDFPKFCVFRLSVCD